MGTGTSTFRICFVRTQKSWSDFFRQSQHLVLTGGSTRHNKKGRDGRFTKRATKNNPHTIAYLVTGHGGDLRSGENNDFQAISALLWHFLASKLGVKKVS